MRPGPSPRPPRSDQGRYTLKFTFSLPPAPAAAYLRFAPPPPLSRLNTAEEATMYAPKQTTTAGISQTPSVPYPIALSTARAEARPTSEPNTVSPTVVHPVHAGRRAVHWDEPHRERRQPSGEQRPRDKPCGAVISGRQRTGRGADRRTTHRPGGPPVRAVDLVAHIGRCRYTLLRGHGPVRPWPVEEDLRRPVGTLRHGAGGERQSVPAEQDVHGCAGSRGAVASARAVGREPGKGLGSREESTRIDGEGDLPPEEPRARNG